MAAEAHDHGTSNLCVVDEAGNVVVLTTTINTVFGAKMTVPKLGIILNDEMDDFSVSPGVPNAYKLRGRRREFDRARQAAALQHDSDHRGQAGQAGADGGRFRRPDHHQPECCRSRSACWIFIARAEEAVANPRLHEQANPDVVLIEEKMPQTTRDALEQMHYRLRVIPALGAVNAITIAPGNLHGAFDPRKGGGAVGYWTISAAR